jgi:hypothetical protein
LWKEEENNEWERNAGRGGSRNGQFARIGGGGNHIFESQ